MVEAVCMDTFPEALPTSTRTLGFHLTTVASVSRSGIGLSIPGTMSGRMYGWMAIYTGVRKGQPIITATMAGTTITIACGIHGAETAAATDAIAT